MSGSAERGSDKPHAFEILLAWSDVTLTAEPGQTALAALLSAGVAIEPGCGSGGCGMCATAYVEGDIEHKDACLTSFEREHLFCPCVSRGRSRIVLAV
jgi:ferredoxin